MAKKFVRGVTGVDDIEKFDKSLTNVNDLISDGQNTYVHTKKGKKEFYYKVTDGVTSVKSTDSTITVEKSDDGTVNLKANPQKVLEHDNLLTDYGISKTTSGNTTKLGIEYSTVSGGYDLNNLVNGRVKSENFLNAPINNYWFFVSSYASSNYTFQEAYTISDLKFKLYKRYKDGSVWLPWREQVGDKSIIDALIAQKQNTLTSNTSIGVLSNNQLIQLYYDKQFYTDAGKGLLKTLVKNVAENTTVNKTIEEFKFLIKINQNVSSANFTLKDADKKRFNKIMTYSTNNTLNISGCVLTLSGSTLTVTTKNNTEEGYLITFSDILD